ncbi:hypothetical protein [Neokomagataea anthophila]|uniref:Uncharacterized protein n=1 Tax=Neokomagataea anthophila TaxID=2826925 RepID=A0ABS5E811_9PROT|nr:hypothetical protein [Neokomagataea anthophila]MBR0560052.1 hypothetical protein [Neokomagataea anthophila]
MSGPRDLNSPLPIQLCNTDGTLTAGGQAFIRRLWERTGFAPGIDTAWIAKEADQALLCATQAQMDAASALREAHAALDLAAQTLIEAQSIRAEALKALEIAQDCAILGATASGNAQAAQSSDESMIFAIMTR